MAAVAPTPVLFQGKCRMSLVLTGHQVPFWCSSEARVSSYMMIQGCRSRSHGSPEELGAHLALREPHIISFPLNGSGCYCLLLLASQGSDPRASIFVIISDHIPKGEGRGSHLTPASCSSPLCSLPLPRCFFNPMLPLHFPVNHDDIAYPSKPTRLWILPVVSNPLSPSSSLNACT